VRTIDLHQVNYKYKIPENFLAHPYADVYVFNEPEWVKTVMETTRYINNNLGTNEKFFALPYAPLYYFLTGKDNPTRHLIFTKTINISKTQELEIIDQLNQKSINYIVLSNISDPTDPEKLPLGGFGRTFCLQLGQFINNNFKVIETFGDWESEAQWASNHGTKILKRIDQK